VSHYEERLENTETRWQREKKINKGGKYQVGSYDLEADENGKEVTRKAAMKGKFTD
jgi:hypothetical protein